MSPNNSELPLLVDRVFDRLRANRGSVLLLDGGTGEELFLNGVPDDRKTWSALAVTDPQYHTILKQVHSSFIRSGAQAITTNSYSITPACGFTPQEIAVHVAQAGRLARETASSADEEVLVLGSLGPLSESYRVDLILPHDEGVKLYKVFVRALKPYVDCYVAETMSSLEESTQVVEAVGSEKPILVSFTLQSDGSLRSGEKVTVVIQELVEFAMRQSATILGVLFNCSEPEAITLALQQIHDNGSSGCCAFETTTRNILLGAYANRLTPVAPDWTMAESDGPQTMRRDVTPDQYCNDFCSKWQSKFNVQLIGGCCGIGPDHIAKLRDRFIANN